MANQSNFNQVQIERYLLGQLTGVELNKFSLQLMRDPALQKEVAAQKLVFKTIWKNNLAGGDNSEGSVSLLKSKNPAFKWLGGLLLIFGIVGLVYWLLSPEDVVKLKPNTPTEDPVENVENVLQDSIAVPVKEEKTHEDKKAVNSKKPIDNQPTIKKKVPKKSPPKPNPPKEKVQRPIAGNFEINPDLEVYITGKRGNSLNLTSPKQMDIFQMDEQGSFDFTLAGSLSRNDNHFLGESTYLYILSNKKEDYIEFKPLVSEELDLQFNENEKHYNFQWERSLELEPGLYYYLIEGEQSGLCFTGKFLLKEN